MHRAILCLIIILLCLLPNAQNALSAQGDFTVQSTAGPRILDPSLEAELVFTGLSFPANMAFIGPNDILITEKNNGTVLRVINGNMMPEPLLDVNVATQGERGMLGIAVTHQNNNTYVFLYYTESVKEDGSDAMDERNFVCACLYRYELIDNKLVNGELLLAIPVPATAASRAHLGGEVLIGPDRNVYLTVGEAGSDRTKAVNFKERAMADGRSGILRVTQDGGVVDGVLGDGFPLNLYYAYGIRNSFGMDFDPLTGNLWDTENGPEFADEVNLVEPGFNSGWRRVQGIWEHGNSRENNYLLQNITTDPEKNLEDFDGKGVYRAPEFVWHMAIGPTALKFLNSDKLGSQYENDIFVGDFHTGSIYNFDLNENRTGLSLSGPLADRVAYNNSDLQPVMFGEGFGGITDIQVGPDGYLYVLSLYYGGDNCKPELNLPCVEYDSHNIGSIFRISPVSDGTDDKGDINADN